MKIVFGLLGFAAMGLSIVFEGGHLNSFLQIGGFILVFGSTFFLSLAHHSADQLMDAFRAALGSDSVSSGDALRHSAVLSTCRTIALGTGAVGFLAGLIHTMQNLDDPTKLGSGIALAFLAAMYAVVLSEFFLGPLSNRIISRADSQLNEQIKQATPSMMIFMVSILGSTVCLFAALYAISK